jgi:hypothetical protein
MNTLIFLGGIVTGVALVLAFSAIAQSLLSRRIYGAWDGWIGRPGSSAQVGIARRYLRAIKDTPVTAYRDSIFTTEAQAFKAWATDALAAMDFGEAAVPTPGSTPMQHIEGIRKTVK